MHEPRVRKIHRKLAKIMADDGDHCTICRMEFLGGEIIRSVVHSKNVTAAPRPKALGLGIWGLFL